MEEWRDIEGYEGKYQVSNLGRVKSLSRKVYNGNGFYYTKSKILIPAMDNKGYNRVHLTKNGIGKTYKLHRLVAKAFIDNPNNLPQVNHKDENKLNNNASNLEWCINEYNRNYGTGQIRANKTKTRKIICITTGEKFDSTKEASEKYNICASGIRACCNNKRKSAGKLADGTRLAWKYFGEGDVVND